MTKPFLFLLRHDYLMFIHDCQSLASNSVVRSIIGQGGQMKLELILSMIRILKIIIKLKIMFSIYQN